MPQTANEPRFATQPPVETHDCTSCSPLAHDAFVLSILNVRITRMRRAVEFIRDHGHEPSVKLWAQSVLDNDDLLF